MDRHDLSAAIWTKSSYSGNNGGDCIEVALTWMKSSYSAPNGGDCIEVAPGFPHVVPVRDSKNPHRPALVFPAANWASFLAAVKGGEFPNP
ncbi:DUF397 domain-containing protein [Streptomyces piniterrae]|uniref:DUF397 domain-containing protein n=1 Tax=Streptomyces piniterrae TaxID=2571125 RepID=A0A4U0MPJ6_9ACTN|nr:DUF397 domain-containing protein [Streptomyces piniterrae]TJZ42755.1 DUF397 domain-containing protein [Streptomyces piniterrae]